VLTACNDSGPGAEACAVEEVRTESGLRFRDLECGEGAPAERGHLVSVRYVGRLASRTVIDSARRHGGVFRFPLGAGVVIAGLDEGVPGMRQGGRRRLVVPPELAFGADGLGDLVPPGETLIFEVELLEVSESPP
jgi:FKBP-type peptidyl-prolyl cis-trans isomerase